MKLKEIGEFGFIDRIARGSICNPRDIIRGIGDDAAVFSIDKNEKIVITTDLLIEKIHFLRDKIKPYDLGCKAMAVNLSDIAAMGARPGHALISIGIPNHIEIAYLDRLYSGLKETAANHGVNIIGGDTTGSESGLVINITLTGSAPKDKILYRNTAKPGDKIFVTGSLGDSRAGLYLILNDIKPSGIYSKLLTAHNRPYPYVQEGRFLAGSDGVHAAIDISDGLSSDLGHIADESGTGFVLYTDSLPVSGSLKKFCEKFSFNIIDYALKGGEDYVLAFTVKASIAKKIESVYKKKFGKEIFCIGEITQKKRLIYRNGKYFPVKAEGWDHFRE
jgi:thiamine-monophosphate kinase